MTNPFEDSRKFMEAVGQTTDSWNRTQFELYLSLIDEEHNEELKEAVTNEDTIEILDALVDILVVTIGAINSIGADAEGAWNEVMRTNFAKIDPVTGKPFHKREDGKVLKPKGWQPPNLKPFVGE
jgi:predicted HAD superfamily Cof-like phosphohydrolase